MVYTSATLSLAALEYIVHLEAVDAPADLVAIAASIPSGVGREEVAAASLPAGWRRYPAPGRLAEIGARWIRESRTAVLVVPSAVIPAEVNYLLNPSHPDFARIRIDSPEPFVFDRRLWRR